MKRNANKKALVGRKGKKNAGETSDFTEVQVEYKPAVGVIELDPLEDPECNFLTRGMHSKRGKLLVTHPSSSAKFLKSTSVSAVDPVFAKNKQKDVAALSDAVLKRFV
ncbi:hypothetical protein QYF36_015913 [Acer negundo]|nr:hypothetical protein QYF36_015913 [Acer negundo]